MLMGPSIVMRPRLQALRPCPPLSPKVTKVHHGFQWIVRRFAEGLKRSKRHVFHGVTCHMTHANDYVNTVTEVVSTAS